MYSVSLHMLMMTTEIASPGLLTTATGYTLDSVPSVRWFHMSDDKFTTTFTSVLGYAQISLPCYSSSRTWSSKVIQGENMANTLINFFY